MVVKLIPSSDVVTLECVANIGPDTFEKIKSNYEKVKALEKDLNVSHLLLRTQDGDYMSRIGRNITDEVDIITEANYLKKVHKTFLNAASKWDILDPEPKKEEENDEPAIKVIKPIDMQMLHVIGIQLMTMKAELGVTVNLFHNLMESIDGKSEEQPE